MNQTVKISFYSSLIFTIFIIAVDICYLFLFANPNPWTSVNEYVSHYRFIEVLPEIIGFIFLPSFLLVINGVIIINHAEHLLTAKISRFFASGFVLVVSIAYFIQFAVFYPNIQSSNNQIYELWMFGNTNQSLAWGLNYLGWFWGGISIFLTTLIIEDRVLKRLFVSYGVLLSIAFVGYCVRIEILQAVLGLAWFVVLPISFIRLTLLLRKILNGNKKNI